MFTFLLAPNFCSCEMLRLAVVRADGVGRSPGSTAEEEEEENPCGASLLQPKKCVSVLFTSTMWEV